MLHSSPCHVAGRVAHFDIALDAGDAGCVRHCPALYAQLPAQHVEWSLTRRAPPVVLTVLADLLGIVSA